MTSEVKADLKIELSDLNYLCSNASMACKGFPEMIETDKRAQLWSIDLRASPQVKIVCNDVRILFQVADLWSDNGRIRHFHGKCWARQMVFSGMGLFRIHYKQTTILPFITDCPIFRQMLQ